MHFVAALDQMTGMRCVFGLRENALTGMADGAWRIAREPACTRLSCAPGLANGPVDDLLTARGVANAALVDWILLVRSDRGEAADAGEA